MHKQYMKRIDSLLTKKIRPSPRVSRGDLKAETESEIIATYDQASQTRYHAKANITFRNRQQIMDSVLR
jgi:hypothetical protein